VTENSSRSRIECPAMMSVDTSRSLPAIEILSVAPVIMRSQCAITTAHRDWIDLLSLESPTVQAQISAKAVSRILWCDGCKSTHTTGIKTCLEVCVTLFIHLKLHYLLRILVHIL
jgi:hypothetical protein